ncbi:hypothetical protein EYS42_06470 [Aquabacterium lacunae]|uniref:Uncharacterized protein n=1 Tax=Aquabacterium lacunae TaxID=2528630 RepID=A0A4Q9H0W3_9BURK|nr:hypothetical protein [Aquabacterium lacunae]TBO32812.1 hypothetical protein EYS42_06470 [Aquabacterium lacunae]
MAGHPIRWYSSSATRQITNPLDPSDALVQLLRLTMRDQVLGLIGPFAPHPVALYVPHANRLKQAGL